MSLLELQNVSKNFGAFTALKDVSFRVDCGEIVGLLGENGAGKSTLLGIVSGNLAPTGGALLWKDQTLHLASPRDATARGIGIVHQHFRLVPSFTVAENIALSAASKGILFSQAEWLERITNWARELDWKIDPAKRVEELGVGERQRVEILKALFAQQGDDGDNRKTAQLLLLDEPTANLTPDEVDDLFEVLQRLKTQGCGLVFVSHKLNEVLALCDRVSVLRHGKLIGERSTPDTSAGELAELMVGRSLPSREKESRDLNHSAPVLEIKNLASGKLRDFTLSVRAGEIVGIAGVDGNGQSELLGAISGLHPATGGVLQIDGESKPMKNTIAFIPADRQHVGLIPAFSLFENLALHPFLRAQNRRWFGLDWKAIRERTRALMKKFDVRAPQAQEQSSAAQLSGGNQQKLVIARALSFPHRVIVAADPTRGLDIAAEQFVHEQLQNAARDGAAVLLISTDLDEVLELSDRIGVLYEGQLLPGPELLPREVSREEIGKLMGGFARA